MFEPRIWEAAPSVKQGEKRMTGTNMGPRPKRCKAMLHRTTHYLTKRGSVGDEDTTRATERNIPCTRRTERRKTEILKYYSHVLPFLPITHDISSCIMHRLDGIFEKNFSTGDS